MMLLWDLLDACSSIKEMDQGKAEQSKEGVETPKGYIIQGYLNVLSYQDV